MSGIAWTVQHAWQGSEFFRISVRDLLTGEVLPWTIEHAYGLAPLTNRDAVVKDLGHAVQIGSAGSGRGDRD